MLTLKTFLSGLAMAALVVTAFVLPVSEPAWGYSTYSDGHGGIVGDDAGGDVQQAVQLFRDSAGSCSNMLHSNQKIECMAGELDALAAELEKPHIATKAPKAAPEVRKSARKLRSIAKSKISRAAKKRAVLSVLRRTRSVMRNLAVKTNDPAKEIYTNVSTAYARAINVVRRRV